MSLDVRRPLGLVVLLVTFIPLIARAQGGAPAAPEERPTGLPSGVQWTFNFDAGAGGFGFRNSLFEDPKEGVKETFGDNWAEGFAKPAISGKVNGVAGGELFGKFSVVGERTYASPPELVGPDESSFFPEDAFIGWRSGKAIPALGDNGLEVTVGRAPFTIGHGLILWDGAAEGGSRGGYWSNARKAWAFATIGRIKTGPNTLEAFYLKKDELPERITDTRLWGGNYEFRPGARNTFGATYLHLWANPAVSPQRNDLNVYNLRAYTAPVPMVPDVTVDAEYVWERNQDRLHADAWTAQGAYELSMVTWKPKFTYRYAFFQGDDPSTTRNEAFDPLLLGFSDWGYWWQGEIAGEYFLSNSNLISHMVRAHVTPNDSIGAGAMYYKFLLDQPGSFAPGVTDRHLLDEIDGYCDWKINKNFTASFVLAFAHPELAAQQAFNRTQNFRYGMVFLAYSY